MYVTLAYVRRFAGPRQAHTGTGLRVTVDGIKKTYQTSHKVPRDFKETMRIVFDDELSKWNDLLN